MRFAFCTLLFTAVLFAQKAPDVAAQRQAMKKLEFLAGQWSGPASVQRGPGEPLKLTQSEHVQFKLDGLVLLIEGASRNADGKTVFQALATVSYDDTANEYRFRAFNDGRYLDTPLSVNTNGFSWAYNAGPAKVTNTMTLSEAGEWVETTEVTMGSAPARRMVEMKLRKQ